jgi:hypothetical protein
MLCSIQNGIFGLSKRLQPWSKTARAARYSSKLWELVAPVSPYVKKFLKETKILKTLRLPIFTKKLGKHVTKSFKKRDYRAYIGIAKDTKAVTKALEIPCKIFSKYGFFPKTALRAFSFFQSTHVIFSTLSMGLAVRGALKASRLAQRLKELGNSSSSGRTRKARKAKQIKAALGRLIELDPRGTQKKESQGGAPSLKGRVKELQSQLVQPRTRERATKKAIELLQDAAARARTLKSLEMIRVAAKGTKIVGLLLACFTGYTTLGPALVAGSALVSFGVWGYSSHM